jgi:hypothetical protein
VSKSAQILSGPLKVLMVTVRNNFLKVIVFIGYLRFLSEFLRPEQDFNICSAWLKIFDIFPGNFDE